MDLLFLHSLLSSKTHQVTLAEGTRARVELEWWEWGRACATSVTTFRPCGGSGDQVLWAMDLQGQGGETGVPEAASNLRGNLRLKPLASHNISISLCLGFFIYTHFLVSKVLARKKP